MSGYRLTVRRGPRVERARFDAVAEALEELEARGRALEREADAAAIDLKVRRFEPVERVVGRLELAGPGIRAGVDVRGDGSSESYTGRVRRRLVECRAGESPYDALRRVLRADGRRS